MKQTLTLLLLAVLLSSSGFSLDLLPGMEMSPKGILKIDGIELKIVHYDDKWGPVDQNWLGEKPGQEVKGALIISGVQPSKKGEQFNFTQTMKKEGECLDVVYDFSSASGVGTNVLALSINLPVNDYSGEKLAIDGKEVPLPEKHQGQQVFSADKVQTLSIPLNNGKLLLTGAFSLYIQDGRQWNGKEFQVRINFPITKGTPVKKSNLHLKMELKAEE